MNLALQAFGQPPQAAAVQGVGRSTVADDQCRAVVADPHGAGQRSVLVGEVYLAVVIDNYNRRRLVRIAIGGHRNYN